MSTMLVSSAMLCLYLNERTRKRRADPPWFVLRPFVFPVVVLFGPVPLAVPVPSVAVVVAGLMLGVYSLRRLVCFLVYSFPESSVIVTRVLEFTLRNRTNSAAEAVYIAFELLLQLHSLTVNTNYLFFY
jgi:hypothetical protein